MFCWHSFIVSPSPFTATSFPCCWINKGKERSFLALSSSLPLFPLSKMEHSSHDSVFSFSSAACSIVRRYTCVWCLDASHGLHSHISLSLSVCVRVCEFCFHRNFTFAIIFILREFFMVFFFFLFIIFPFSRCIYICRIQVYITKYSFRVFRSSVVYRHLSANESFEERYFAFVLLCSSSSFGCRLRVFIAFGEWLTPASCSTAAATSTSQQQQQIIITSAATTTTIGYLNWMRQ